MVEKLLLIGRSGVGKSTSLRNLDPNTTAILKCVNKKLPFKKGDTNFKSMYVPTAQDITSAVAKIITKAPHIKTIVLDDVFYSMAFENFRRSSDKGYQKFTDMAKQMFDIITLPDSLPEEVASKRDITFIYITHSETNPNTMETDIKTIGKMLESQLGIAGLFTIVLEAMIVDGEYKILTHNINGNSVVKTPMGMFEDDYIDNDMKYVLDKIKEYY